MTTKNTLQERFKKSTYHKPKIDQANYIKWLESENERLQNRIKLLISKKRRASEPTKKKTNEPASPLAKILTVLVTATVFYYLFTLLFN